MHGAAPRCSEIRGGAAAQDSGGAGSSLSMHRSRAQQCRDGPSSMGAILAPPGLNTPGRDVAGGGGGPGEALVGFGSVPGEAPGASQRRSGAHPGPGWRSCPGGVTRSLGLFGWQPGWAQLPLCLPWPRLGPPCPSPGKLLGSSTSPRAPPHAPPGSLSPTFGHLGAASSITWCCPLAPDLVP